MGALDDLVEFTFYFVQSFVPPIKGIIEFGSRWVKVHMRIVIWRMSMITRRWDMNHLALLAAAIILLNNGWHTSCLRSCA
ncbi:hypothetical protein F4604DRAFT_1716843 [Suillus subluteus]|nr:hypothetical protein F4604DRAFT_1716843 [Suillus subluteus]